MKILLLLKQLKRLNTRWQIKVVVVRHKKFAPKSFLFSKKIRIESRIISQFDLDVLIASFASEFFERDKLHRLIMRMNVKKFVRNIKKRKVDALIINNEFKHIFEYANFDGIKIVDKTLAFLDIIGGVFAKFAKKKSLSKKDIEIAIKEKSFGDNTKRLVYEFCHDVKGITVITEERNKFEMFKEEMFFETGLMLKMQLKSRQIHKFHLFIDIDDCQLKLGREFVVTDVIAEGINLGDDVETLGILSLIGVKNVKIERYKSNSKILPL